MKHRKRPRRVTNKAPLQVATACIFHHRHSPSNTPSSSTPRQLHLRKTLVVHPPPLHLISSTMISRSLQRGQVLRPQYNRLTSAGLLRPRHITSVAKTTSSDPVAPSTTADAATNGDLTRPIANSDPSLGLLVDERAANQISAGGEWRVRRFWALHFVHVQ